MDKTTAQQSIKKVNTEVFSLNPSALLTLYEIDLTALAFKSEIISSTEYNQQEGTVFRFHNNSKLNTTSIFWQGKEFVAAPIQADGFETSIKGVMPTPKLYISVNDQGIQYLSLLKQKIYELSYDLVGTKVTRIRTFARYIDAVNFFDNSSIPAGFDPDPNAELPRDVFYINRKSLENKNYLEFELASILDVEGVKLPQRLVLANSCPFQYRGQGCKYEYNTRRVAIEHGEVGESSLPVLAPPVANSSDEVMSKLLDNTPLTDRGQYNSNAVYKKGDFVHLEFNNIKYYFVAKIDNVSVAPPNINYWIADNCSKTVNGCELRFGTQGSAIGFTLGVIPYGGFSCATRFR